MGCQKYKKNDLVTVAIEDIGNDGEGIGKTDGYTLFVKDAVIGDTVLARITKCKKNYGYAKVEKVVTPSSFRVEPKCRFHRQCGGCQIQAMHYDRQLIYKQDKVRNNLLRIGGFTEERIAAVMEPMIGMENPWHYRNKAQYPVGCDRDGNPVVGFYAGRTHSIVANTDCALGALENREILETILQYMREYDVPAYRETDCTGLVRHILIRTGFQSGEIMVCIVINGKRLPAEDTLIERLKELRFDTDKDRQSAGDKTCSFPAAYRQDLPDCGGDIEISEGKSGRDRAAYKRIKSISLSINTDRTNVIMGQEIRLLWGDEKIQDTLGGITFSISPLSFYQVNPAQTERLYELAVDYAGLTGKETVWDLYCGIGTISLFMAKKAKQVYGVEVIPQAIQDARDNARNNGIENVSFFVGKAEEVLPAFYEGKLSAEFCENVAAGSRNRSDIAMEKTDFGAAAQSASQPDSGSDWNGDGAIALKEKMRHPDVIVVDPPRKGCDEKCLATMLAMQPERIVYVSCDSATLARDLRILSEGGYELRRVRAVDQFGHSVHVEVACCLQRKDL